MWGPLFMKRVCGMTTTRRVTAFFHIFSSTSYSFIHSIFSLFYLLLVHLFITSDWINGTKALELLSFFFAVLESWENIFSMWLVRNETEHSVMLWARSDDVKVKRKWITRKNEETTTYRIKGVSWGRKTIFHIIRQKL